MWRKYYRTITAVVVGTVGAVAKATYIAPDLPWPLAVLPVIAVTAIATSVVLFLVAYQVWRG